MEGGGGNYFIVLFYHYQDHQRILHIYVANTNYITGEGGIEEERGALVCCLVDYISIRC